MSVRLELRLVRFRLTRTRSLFSFSSFTRARYVPPAISRSCSRQDARTDEGELQIHALPKYTSASVVTACKNYCGVYLDYAGAYSAHDSTKITAIYDKNIELFTKVRPPSPSHAPGPVLTKRAGPQRRIDPLVHARVQEEDDTEAHRHVHLPLAL